MEFRREMTGGEFQVLGIQLMIKALDLEEII